MILTIKMNSGDEIQVELDDAPTNRKGKFNEIKDAMKNGTIVDAADGITLNGKFIESISAQSIEDEDFG